MPLEIVFLLNDNIIEISGLILGTDGTEVTDANIELVDITDMQGNTVPGFNGPIKFTNSSGSNTYAAVIPNTVAWEDAKKYDLHIKATYPANAYWQVPVRARERSLYADN